MLPFQFRAESLFAPAALASNFSLGLITMWLFGQLLVLNTRWEPTKIKSKRKKEHHTKTIYEHHTQMAINKRLGDTPFP